MGGGRIKTLLKIVSECRSLTRVTEVNPYRRSSINVMFNGGGTLIFPNTFVTLPSGMLSCNNIWLGMGTFYAATPGQSPGVARIYIYIHMKNEKHSTQEANNFPASARSNTMPKWTFKPWHAEMSLSSVLGGCTWKNFVGPKKSLPTNSFLNPLRTKPLRTWGYPRS